MMKNTLVNASLSVAACVVAFALIETGYRIVDGNFKWESARAHEFNLLKSSYPAQFDPALGWRLRPQRFNPNKDEPAVTIGDDFIRSNGAPSEGLRPGPPILAIGDSFTFGQQVADSDSWPAALERLSRIRVINGGVFGYGIDQAYLWGVQLMDRYKPAAVVFSFIWDDISRTELSQRTGVPKPYFTIVNGGVDLHTAHVVEPHDNFASALKNLLSYSHTVHSLMSKLAPMFWWSRSGAGQIQVHNEGVAVSCALLLKLKREVHDRGAKLYLLAQYPEHPDPLRLL